MIDRRLATLSDDARDVLTTAAVIGREFRIELLEELGSYDEDKLDEVVDESVAAHVIAEVPGVYGRFSFTHSLIRQTLYDGLTGDASRPAAPARRRGARAARRRSPRRARPPLLPVAAGPRRRQGRRVRASGPRSGASAQLAYEEAARLYEVALQALEQSGADGEQRCELLLACGDAQTKAGDVDRRARDVPRRRRRGPRARLGQAARAGGARLRLGGPDGRRRGRRDRRAADRGGARGGRRQRSGAARAAARPAGDGAELLRPARAPRRAQQRGGRHRARGRRHPRPRAGAGRAPLVAVGAAERAGAPRRRRTTCWRWPSARATSGSRCRATAGG